MGKTIDHWTRDDRSGKFFGGQSGGAIARNKYIISLWIQSFAWQTSVDSIIKNGQ